MSSIRFELNRQGVAKLLHSQEMSGALLSAAKLVAANAGTHYEAKQMPTRVIALPADEEGEQDNYEHNTLLKAVHK